MIENYIKFSFPKNENHQVIVAELSVLFEVSGFEENLDDISFYLDQSTDQVDSINHFLAKKGIVCRMEEVANENWNAIWESSFSPIEIGKFCRIRASFHELKSGFRHEVLINPEMAFGTGHHETTYLMIKAMSDLSFLCKSVLDYGCGTGVLAIIAEQEGAASVFAIDIDQNAVENAKQNFQINNCLIAESSQNSSPLVLNLGKVDILLANINRNVLIETLPEMVAALKEKGHILISGLLLTDKFLFLETANSFSLKLIEEYEKNEWVCLLFQK